MSRICWVAAALALGMTMAGADRTLAQSSPALNGPIVGDPARGEQIFKKCKQCHTVEPNLKKVGPSLAGVLGRRPGGVEGFGYSQDMIAFGAAGNIWSKETLDVFLTKPRNLIRQTKMAFPGLKKEADRADLIAYLTQF